MVCITNSLEQKSSTTKLLLIRPWLLSLAFIALLSGSNLLQAASKSAELTPESVLRQELLLNQLIVDIHLLQLDFLNNEARERLLDHLALLDKSIPAMPKQSADGETTGLLASSLALWPVISRHARWMGKLPAEASPPEASSLLLALAKLDRQLLLLRQKLLTEKPPKTQHLNILEQALLMQRLSREYLSLTVSQQEQIGNNSRQAQLQTLAQHFDQRLGRLSKKLRGHPHAGTPIRQASAAWKFISGNIGSFPKQPVPELVALYTDRIVNKLTSIHQMF